MNKTLKEVVDGLTLKVPPGHTVISSEMTYDPEEQAWVCRLKCVDEKHIKTLAIKEKVSDG